MAFRGLFIGIDRYESSAIRWLSSAERDATALHAIFADNLGGEPALLTGADATRARIVQELRSLIEHSQPDDLVVIAFSGHGSTTHDLVPFDADVARPEETFLPLAEFAELLNQIKAKTMMCVLDCCFSGGMEAKVYVAPLQERGISSEAEFMEQISGKGRIVLAASAANESAYEHSATRHGLLTYHLLTALQGAPEVVTGGKLDIYKVLQYVTQQVTDQASRLRKEQHPALRGSLDGTPTWPIFSPGPTYGAAFPERMRQPATEDIYSLANFGMPTVLLDRWSESIPSLNGLQVTAINEYGILDGENLLVTAPTSSGKTLVGELAALQRVLDRRRAVFLLPMRALVNDKFTEFTNKYGDIGVRTIRATGEISDDMPELMNGQYDVCLMTYEKFSNLVLVAPHLLTQVGTIVVDEVQMIVDRNRGPNLEFLLTLINSRRAEGIEPQVICLSAVIGDSGGLERWLGGRQVRREDRPVPLVEGVIDRSGNYRFLNEQGVEQAEKWIDPIWTGKNSSQDVVIPLVAKLVQAGQQVIVFREKKGETLGSAGYLAAQLGLPPATDAIDRLPQGDPSASSNTLRQVLQGGVAFHNADLSRVERQVLEEEFRRKDSSLRVLTATTTLAMGVNTPASAVVIVGLTHPGPQPTPYSVAEYKNMVGRAGRLGFSERGESYVVCGGGVDQHRIWQHYVLGSPEDIRSVFLASDGDPRGLVLRTLAALEPPTSAGVDAQTLTTFLESSFGAFQERERNSSWTWNHAEISRVIAELVRHELIAVGEDGTYRSTALGRFAGESGLHVESVLRLVTLLRNARAVPNSTTLIAAAQVTVEVDDVYLIFNKRARNTELVTWLRQLQGQAIDPAVLQFLGIGGDATRAAFRAKKAMACLMYASRLPLAGLERSLTQHNLEKVVAGAVRGVADRTRDLIPAVARVYEFLHPGTDLGEIVDRTMLRLELGIAPELCDIAAVLGSRLSRAQYQVLGSNGVASLDQFMELPAADLASMLSLTDEDIAGLQERIAAQTEVMRARDQVVLPPPTE